MALETGSAYPIYYAASEDNKIARWRPLAHWAMAIPHLIVGYVINLVAGVCTVICWFAIVITGKMPEGLANVIIMSQRYWIRVAAFANGLTEVYPPFEFESQAGDPGNYPVRLDVQPALEGRNRLTVFFRFFTLIPIIFFFYIISIGASVVGLIAWFAVLFTGVYPPGMRDFVIKSFRLGARVGGYGSLLTDEYPPFELV